MRARLFRVLIILPILIWLASGKDVSCPNMCNCSGSKALCTGNHFTYVPRFPNNIQEINISNSNLSEIRRDGLFNLTFIHVIIITFRHNGIRYIHKMAFQNITNLVRFEISNEKGLMVGNVMDVLENMETRHLQRLRLFNNGWNYIPRDMFETFSNSKLLQLYLYGNNFQFINFNMFSRLTRLQRLDLHGNQISRITTHESTTLHELNLQHNVLEVIPQWCPKRGKTTNFPNLIRLYLGYNSIKQVTAVQCLPRLHLLSLEYNLVGKIQGNAFNNLPCLQILNLQAFGKPVRKIEPDAFNISSLKSLTLSNCYFQFYKSSYDILSKMFVNTPNLETLNLDGNNLPNNDQSLKLLFNPVSKLKKLNLNSCKLQNFPLDVSAFRHLRALTLRSNRLQSLNYKAIDIVNLSFLEHLDLQGNIINIVNSSSIPFHLLTSLKQINLGDNPYYCVCDQMWFVNWLRKTNIILEDYPRHYACVQPPDMKNMLLKDYKPTAESCTPLNPILTIVLSISVFGVLVFILVIVIIKCQTNIKNYIYLLRVSSYRKLGYLPINGDEDFEYHAFIVYCDADRSWVHDKFVRKLETEEGLRLCIHHRDFEVGETITGNIDNFLRKSWKVVVIISNEFAKSEWCQWEVDIVQERRRRLGRDVFLVVMLKDVTTKFMTSSLRTLLDSTSFLKYKQGVGEELFWRAVIKGLTKPLGNPPVSVFT